MYSDFQKQENEEQVSFFERLDRVTSVEFSKGRRQVPAIAITTAEESRDELIVDRKRAAALSRTLRRWFPARFRDPVFAEFRRRRLRLRRRCWRRDEWHHHQELRFAIHFFLLDFHIRKSSFGIIEPGHIRFTVLLHIGIVL